MRSTARSPRSRSGTALEHRDEDERARGPPVHRGALPRVPGRGARGPQHSRRVLHAPGRARDLRQRAHRLRRRALPGALADLRLPPRRRGQRLHGLRRPDAARNLDTRVELVTPRSRSPSRARSCWTRSSARWPTTPHSWELRSDGSWEPVQAGSAEPRSVQDELMRPPRGPRRRGRERAPGVSDPELLTPRDAAGGRCGSACRPAATAAWRRCWRPSTPTTRSRPGGTSRRSTRRGAWHVRPLVGPHPDRLQHRAAHRPAALPPRRRRAVGGSPTMASPSATPRS